MKEIEITTKLNHTMNEVASILTKQGFKLKEFKEMKDKYLTHNSNELTKDNIIDVLKNSILIRYVCVDYMYIYKMLIYKNKEYDNDVVLTEEKITVNIDDIDKIENLLKKIGFKNIVEVNTDMYVYQNDKLEFAIQDIEGLGLYIEYENLNSFNNSTPEEIIKEKEKMLDEIRSYNLDVDDDYDVKKAYTLIKKRIN